MVADNEFNGDERREYERRAAAGVDWFHGLPSWARIIFVIGVPSAIAVFLVYVGSKNIPQIMIELAVIQNSERANHILLTDIKSQNEAMYRMLQRTCYNTAKTESDRSKCFDR